MTRVYLFFTGCMLGIGLACAVQAVIIAIDIRKREQK